jgi:hypothetical protein|tara:strand:+ start:32455 stop:32628 length:174 start_codon:yes stop_codon:yes gene_type:complete
MGLKTMWEMWCKAIGRKAYDNDSKADRVAMLRTLWIILHIATCIAIIAGNGRTLEIW